MARTIQVIYDALITEKETHSELNGLVPNPDDSQTFLDDLTSTSKVAIWRHWYWVVAVAIHVFEVILDEHTTEVAATVAAGLNGTSRWLREEALKYQHGDALVFDSTTKTFVYAVLDPVKQIIERAAVVESGGQATIKVAKLVATIPVPLDAAELSGFTTYINQIRYAGTNIGITSLPSDKLKIAYNVVYDPLVLDAAGILISDGVTKPVEDAINTAISDLSTLENFNGVLNLTSLTDAVQLAVGVIDPILTQSEAKPDGGTYLAFTVNYSAASGYMEIDPAFPLSTQITYIPAT